MWRWTGLRSASRLNQLKTFCARGGTVKEATLELEFQQIRDVYEDKIREVYRPKGLLAYAMAAREYVKIL
jgi:translation initiation factor 1 (eIF-1/SUI1)